MNDTGRLRPFPHAFPLAVALSAAILFPARMAESAPPAKAADGFPGDVYLKQITLDEAAQFISQVGKASVVVSSSVANKVVSLYLRDVNVEGMVRSLCRAAGVWYRYDPQTKAYILMNAQEYQQDIAITRDEITRSYVLRHHNVVSIANAIEALFGDRVNLVEPVEEMPPVEMGGTGRSGSGSGSYGGGYGGGNSYGGSSYGGGRSSYGGGNAYGNSGYGGNRGSSGSSRRSFSTDGVSSRRGGGSSRQQQDDPRKEMGSISQAGLEAALDIDSAKATSVDAAGLIAAAAKSGPAINVTYNLLHNLLLVRTSDEATLKEIDRLVQEMDRPPRQVLLEMKILEVELGADFRSVFDIGWSSKGTSPGPTGIGYGAPLSGTPDYPKSAVSLGNFIPENAATAVWQVLNDNLRLRIQFLEGENRVNVLATPMLVAANNQPARLFIGDEQVLVTGASADSVTGTTGATTSTITVETQQRNVGQTLVILPRINADRSVTLTIDQDNSRINSGGTTLPLAMPNGGIYQFPIDTVNTANLQVTAHARDGLTVAVGGMISQRVTDVEEKVPLLGDIPGLGLLFKRTVRGNARKQIVLLITPHVLETAEESDALAQEKAAGLRQLDASNSRWGGALPAKRNSRDSIFDPATGFAASDTATVSLAATAPAPGPASSEAETERLAGLARAAFDAIRQEDPAAPPPHGLQSVPLSPDTRQPRQLDEGLELRAVAAWQKDGYYVTALRAINLSPQPTTLTPTRIVGHWSSMVVEREQLAPANGEASWTWIYAISRTPYEQALEKP